MGKALNSIVEIRQANKDAGYNLFSPGEQNDTSRKFSGKVFPTEGGTYFVMSEMITDEEGRRRRYSVRFCYSGNPNRGKVINHSYHFNYLEALEEARKEAYGDE